MKFQSQRFLAAVVLAILVGGVVAPAQQRSSASNGAKVVRAHSFEPNEELILNVEYSRALLKNVDVAEFRFTSQRQDPLQKSSPYSLKFTGEVTSKGFFSKLFNLKFREWMESIVEPASFSVHKTKRVDEQGKRQRISEAVFANGKVSWTERDPNNPGGSPRTADAAFEGQVHDVLSAIYFLRTQPLALGKTLELTISDSGRVYKVPVRVVEKKRMKTVVGRVEALRVDPELFGPNAMLNRKGHLSIWYTNDSRRIPVKAKIKTEFGTFDVSLKKIIRPTASKEYLTSNR